MKKITRNLISAAGGLVIGFVNGFFGGGGGMLLVPMMEKLLKEETKTAHATAILIILPVSMASAVMYIINGYTDATAILTVSAGVLAGGISGALLLKILPPRIVGLIFALSMIALGIKLVV